MVITKHHLGRNLAIWLGFLLVCTLARPAASAEKPDKKTADKKTTGKAYALIFGTAYGPDDRPLYGVRIVIKGGGTGKKTSRWELISDHRGEFAQRVPPGPGDYLVRGEAEYAPAGEDGKPQMSKKKTLRGETKVHLEGEERQDIGVHLTE